MLRRMSVFGLRHRRGMPPPPRVVRIVRATLLVAIAVTAFLLVQRFRVWQVPAGMDTDPALPAGAYCLVDRAAKGLRVGSSVFVASPHGEVVSKVATLDGDVLTVRNPNAQSRLPDSASFGALPRSAVLGVVLSVFASAPEPARGR